MSQCKECYSYAINPHIHGREAGADLDLCDVCYWRKRAIEAKAEMRALEADCKSQCDEYENTECELEARIRELEKENTVLRASTALGGGPCIYCTLPREDWSKCASGFPGCSRGDDAMLCPHMGAELESQMRIRDLEAQLAAHEKVCAGEWRPATLGYKSGSIAREIDGVMHVIVEPEQPDEGHHEH